MHDASQVKPVCVMNTAADTTLCRRLALLCQRLCTHTFSHTRTLTFCPHIWIACEPCDTTTSARIHRHTHAPCYSVPAEADPKLHWWMANEPRCHGDECGILVRATWTGNQEFHYGLIARSTVHRAKRIDVKSSSTCRTHTSSHTRTLHHLTHFSPYTHAHCTTVHRAKRIDVKSSSTCRTHTSSHTRTL